MENLLSSLVMNKQAERQPIAHLDYNHPEADTRLCLHMLNVDVIISSGDIVVRVADVDILVIPLHYMHIVNSNVWVVFVTEGHGN